ncbi:MAG: hypothetical protein ACE5DO_10700, partial [Desulfobacterales bacterium]
RRSKTRRTTSSRPGETPARPVADVVLEEGKPVWGKLFHRLGSFFNKRFGPDWKERNKFFEEFEQALQKEKDKNS